MAGYSTRPSCVSTLTRSRMGMQSSGTGGRPTLGRLGPSPRVRSSAPRRSAAHRPCVPKRRTTRRARFRAIWCRPRLVGSCGTRHRLWQRVPRTKRRMSRSVVSCLDGLDCSSSTRPAFPALAAAWRHAVLQVVRLHEGWRVGRASCWGTVSRRTPLRGWRPAVRAIDREYVGGRHISSSPRGQALRSGGGSVLPLQSPPPRLRVPNPRTRRGCPRSAGRGAACSSETKCRPPHRCLADDRDGYSCDPAVHGRTRGLATMTSCARTAPSTANHAARRPTSTAPGHAHAASRFQAERTRR